MISIKSRLKHILDDLVFYCELFWEVINFSFLWEFIKRKNLFPRWNIPARNRSIIQSHQIKVLVHEWGGYGLVRYKGGTHKINKFKCGLASQIERYKEYHGEYDVNLTISLSDSQDYPYIRELSDKGLDILCVPNEGYDFSGYACFYDNIRGKDDCFVILSNTSVNASCEDFLDGYISYMKKNIDVGALGISCCSKCYQTFIRNNFHPHIQSFFVLTTKSILDEVVEANNGRFPGYGITNKRLLIREGEIKLSQIILNLGYSLGVVLENGEVYKFRKNNRFYNGYNEWTLPQGDIRAFVKEPNKINPIIL